MKNISSLRSEILRRLQVGKDLSSYGWTQSAITSILATEFLSIGDNYIDLGNCYLKDIPDEIFELVDVNYLVFSDNGLYKLSEKIRKLENLNFLDLSRNKLYLLPEEIGDLCNIQNVDLSYNNFSMFPKELCRCKGLEKLSLMGNNLVDFPPEIKQLTNLTELNLSDCNLTQVPPVLFELKSLKVIKLDNNNIASISSDIKKLKALHTISLFGNNQLPIPFETLSRYQNDAQRIVDLILDLNINDNCNLNECKILVVGEANVGKTSLVNRIVYNEFCAERNSTEGIEITNWKELINENEITFRIWDFGGQEIMHSTHQFFLTKRCIYLFVVDATQSELSNRVDYWLSIIRCFSEDSPIIFIFNKADKIKCYDINTYKINQEYSIHSFVSTDCKNSDLENGGILNLIDKIKKCMISGIYTEEKIPFSWNNVKLEIEDLQEPYITYECYSAICDKHNVMNSRDKDTLLRLLHDLGVALNYSLNDRLCIDNTSVLNPKWVVNGVYKVIHDEEIILKKGLVEEESLIKCLAAENDYSYVGKERFIIDLMLKFELCFKLDDNSNAWIVPELLLNERPSDVEKYFDMAQPILFSYKYFEMPRSIISRFITKTHSYNKYCLWWRSGTLVHKGEFVALVEADFKNNRILIRISGIEHYINEYRENQTEIFSKLQSEHVKKLIDDYERSLIEMRIDFLECIRSYFIVIHESISNLNPCEEVPVSQVPLVYHPLKHLFYLISINDNSYSINNEITINPVDTLKFIDKRSLEMSRHNNKDATNHNSNTVLNANSIKIISSGNDYSTSINKSAFNGDIVNNSSVTNGISEDIFIELAKNLKLINVKQEDINDLHEAINSDPKVLPDNKEFGKNVKDWMLKQMGKLVTKSWDYTLETAPAKLHNLIAKYYESLC